MNAELYIGFLLRKNKLFDNVLHRAAYVSKSLVNNLNRINTINI